MFQDQLLDLKKVQAWLASRGDEAWEWGGAASSLLQVRRRLCVLISIVRRGRQV
jgi:hypothetical protein